MVFSKRTREGTSLVDLWLVKDFTRMKEISRTTGCVGIGYVVAAGIINVIWFLWHSRNQIRFENGVASKIAIQLNVSMAVALSRNFSKGMIAIEYA